MSREAASNGDAEAFRPSEEQARELIKAATAFARRHTSPTVDQAEIVGAIAERFVKYYDPERGSVRAFAFGVGSSVFVDYARKTFRKTHSNISLDALDPRGEFAIPGDPADIPDGTSVDIENAIGQLPLRQQQAMRLKLRDLTDVQVAETLGISPGSAKSHIRRAHRALQPLLGIQEADPEWKIGVLEDPGLQSTLDNRGDI